MRRPNVFTIAPGTPFLKTFAEALRAGQIINGLSLDDPFALAQVTIYVPTRRAARALADELAAHFLGASTAPSCGRPIQRAFLLPRIRPFGGLEETETSLLFDAAALDLDAQEDIPLAASDIARRMQLTELILKWAEALGHAIVRISPDGTIEHDRTESFSVARSITDAWHLSGQLAQLIDELTIEGIEWEKLDPLVLPEFDAYWRITLDFLNIAIKSWPEICAEQGWIDAAKRRILLLAGERRRLDEGETDTPVIALGSPGFNRTTADLLASIARAPRGAVILPGVDQDLDEAAFQTIDQEGFGHSGFSHPSFSHPQAVFARLLPIIGIKREDIVPLGSLSAPLALRARFLSEALRPADTTDEWINFQKQLIPLELTEALRGITLIEADDEREEALALAIALREILETPGKTAALVTPDRLLARRVRTELLRWNIEIDDSGGDPLNTSPRGLLARLALACITGGMSAKDLAALLANDEVRLGFPRAELAASASLFEITILRSLRAMRWFDEPEKALKIARDEAEDGHAHPARACCTEEDWQQLSELLARLRSALLPLRALTRKHSLIHWITAHRLVLGALAAEDNPEEVPTPRNEPEISEDVAALEALFDELAGATPRDLLFDAMTYAAFFTSVSAETRLRGPRRAHPRLKILGLIEARLMHADVMLLGGLDETIWPPAAQLDAFLNRPMRAALGLTPPERRLGQSAHDFTQAMGAGEVILSRARKRGSTPTIASRFLQRMAALAGPGFDFCTMRGARFLSFAQSLDQPPAGQKPDMASGRPNPKPPLDLRPRQLSITRIETLQRDPYAIYAELILGLGPLDPLCAALDRREDGIAIHAVLEQCGRDYPEGPLPATIRDHLLEALRHALTARMDDPDFIAFEWPRLAKAIDVYLAFEAERRGAIRQIDVECAGRLEFPLDDGSSFRLTARADRLEYWNDGSIMLVDYKTGQPPSVKEVQCGLAPQLTLEAAMARRGAFGSKGKAASYGGLYLKLGGASGGEAKPMNFASKGGKASGKGSTKRSAKKEATDEVEESITFDDVAEMHFAGLQQLLNQFRDPATGYASRLAPKYVGRPLAYDHLARVAEWAAGGVDEGE